MFLSCVIERVVRMRFRCQNKSWIYKKYVSTIKKKKLRRLQKSQQIFFKIDTLELERYCQANFASNMWGHCPWVIELVNKQIRGLLSSQQQGRCVVQFPTLHKKIVKIEITCVRKSLGHLSLADCKQSTLYKEILPTVTACHRKEFQVPN